MLWERVDAGGALTERFGFTDLADAEAWLTGALADRWGLTVSSCTRVVISDVNLIAWVTTDSGPVVVKACHHQPAFERLAAIAGIVSRLGAAGLPVAPPIGTPDGVARPVLAGPSPLSVIVQPEVGGQLLDTTDPAAVFASGAMLARLHEALSDVDDAGLPRGSRGTEVDLRARLSTPTPAHAAERAPGAAARLPSLLAELPDVDRAPQPTHNDYRGANILTTGHAVSAVLDFDELSIDHRVHDLANAVVLLATRFTSWRPSGAPARQALVDGYRSVAALTPVELGWLEACTVCLGLRAIPAGADPDGWADAVEHHQVWSS